VCFIFFYIITDPNSNINYQFVTFWLSSMQSMG